MIAHSRNDAGFTLVELLVTLSLLSLMLVYSVSAFSMLKDLDRVSEDAAAQQEVEAAARHMRVTLSDIRVWFQQDSAGKPKILFEGHADAIRLVSVSNGERETGGLYAVRVRLDEQGQLIAERALLQRSSSDRPNIAVLLTGVDSVRFAYASVPETRQTPVFEDEWQVTNSLPLAIRMVVTFGQGDRRRWPDTIVPVRAAQ